ncbi:MAG: M14 family metallopeptidase [Allomuricauda sp.]
MIDHRKYKQHNVQGRYITLEKLQAHWLGNLEKSLVQDVGNSVQGRALKSITLGSGNKRVLMWSQMHGNESTTTKAVVDMINFLLQDDPLVRVILGSCTLFIIPILNPDGAKAYTRDNAKQMDLNRDAKLLTQPESKALRAVFERFKPDYCFNLHDQRTLFSAGKTKKPATVSFLSPASNLEREVTPSREIAMKLIVGMEKRLRSMIPGQIGRYDDAFNPNCVGDTFQMLGVPTVLFEAGHYPGDYDRELTREFIFHALLESLKTIALDTLQSYSTEDYFDIPENQKLFYDVLVKNAQMVNPTINPKHQIGIRFKEVLEGDAIQFTPEIVDIKDLSGYYGHETFDCENPEDLKSLAAKSQVFRLVKGEKK